MRNFMLGLLALLIMTGCTIDNTADLRPAPQMTLAQFTPIRLPVRVVDVLTPEAANTAKGQGTLPMPIDTALATYARQRFAAAGGKPNMTVTVVETRFKKSPLRDVTGAGLGILTMQRVQDVEIGARVRIEIIDGPRQQIKQEYNLSSRLELSDQLSLAERDLKLVRFTEGFLVKLDTQILDGLQNTFPDLHLQKIAPTPAGEM